MRISRRLLPLIGALCSSAALILVPAPARGVLVGGDGAGATEAWATAPAPAAAVTEPSADGAVPPTAPGPSGSSAGSWTWPVRGPVVRPFDAPEDPYGPGHRGIDIAAQPGTPVVAPADGVVTFAGQVGGHLFVTIDHGGDLRSTCSWVSVLSVRAGDVVRAGQEIARTGWGHPGAEIPHLHFGVRLGGTYVDPTGYLGPPSVIDLVRLAPVE